MNFLKKAFTTQSYQFKVALKAQDAAAVGKLLDAGYELGEENMRRLANEGGPEILQAYFQKFAAQPGWGELFRPLLYCLEENNFERVDTMLGLKINFNREWYKHHPLKKVFTCTADKQKKLRWLEKMTAKGIDGINDTWYEQYDGGFLKDAIAHNFPEAVDLAVRLGISPHAEDEKFLRYAAALHNKEMCLYLVEKYGADLARATAAAGPETEALLFLSSLQAEPKPSSPQEKPATIESLSAETKALREMVAELTLVVKQQQVPVVRLDKSSPNSSPELK